MDCSVAKNETTAMKYLSNMIRDLGYSAATFLPRSTREIPDYTLWNVCLDITIVEEISTMGDNNTLDDEKEFCGLELVSPIYYEDRTCDQEIRNIFGTNGIQASISLYTNRTTGLHIHVGFVDGEASGFSLDQVRALAFSIIFFEGVFASLANSVNQ